MPSSKTTTKRPTVADGKKDNPAAAGKADFAAPSVEAARAFAGQLDVIADVFDAQPRLGTLREKYLDLARKYTNIVTLMEKSAAQQAIVFRLGLWALNVTANALAVVRDDQVTMQNARWLQFDEVSGGGWRDADDDAAPMQPDLSRIARAEAKRVPERAPASLVRRFRRVRGDKVIELRLERPASDPRVVLAVAHDVTEQVHARRELSQIREALLQSEQLAVVGELASSVAHDLGNTLRGISARVSALAQDGATGDGRAALLEGLRESVDAATASVRNLQEVARVGRLDPGPVDLAEVIRRAAEIVQLRHPREAQPIEVRVDLERMPPVLGTVSELSQLFINLFFNARDAMPNGGTIDVAGTIMARGRGRGRGRGRVTVSDTGTGFPPQALTHLFQPFFTTKGSAGTGLGLWLAQNTMRRFGGAIAARNRRRGGAQIELEFQLVTNGNVTQDPARARARARRAPAS